MFSAIYYYGPCLLLVSCGLWRHLRSTALHCTALQFVGHTAGWFVYSQLNYGKDYNDYVLMWGVVLLSLHTEPSSDCPPNVEPVCWDRWSWVREGDLLYFLCCFVDEKLEESVHNTPSSRSVGINNSAGDEFCQKRRAIYFYFFLLRLEAAGVPLRGWNSSSAGQWPSI